jgi:hypothetical protein
VRPLIIEVPSPLGRRPSGVELAPDRSDRATGVLNPDGIAEVARSLAGVIESASGTYYGGMTANSW